MPKLDLTEHLDKLINIIVSSEGDLPLAASRIKKILGLDETPNEYDIIDSIIGLDSELQEGMIKKFRTLLAIRLFYMIHMVTDRLAENIGNLRPSDLARTHSTLTNSFSTLTTSSTKITFDFDREAAKIAEELNIPVDEVKSEVKSMKKIAETGFGSSNK
jgi:hypothetical protein